MSSATAREIRSLPVRKESKAAPAIEHAGSRLKEIAPASYHLVWITALLLLVTGMCMVLSVSVAKVVTGEGKYVYLRPQAIAAVAGLVLLVVLARVDYRKFRRLSVVFLGVAGFLLLLVHVPPFGQTVGGGTSYLKVGSLTLQPSEFAKLALILVGAHLLTTRRVRSGSLRAYMWPFGAVGLGICGLVTLEGDLGTAIIIAGLLLGMLWLGGMQMKHWWLVAGTGVVTAAALIFSSPERTSRIFSFLNPSADPQGSSYQLWQSLVALGRGGWFGVGPGESVQKFQYLPKAHTDMIFSILGEEFGLLGAGMVLVLFVAFGLACWQLARRCADPMGKYLIAGCGMLVTLQAVVNIGGVIGALPLTGVPLPFISYGRSSLVVMLMAVGVILAVARRAPARPASSPAVRYSNVTRLDRRRRDGGPRGARIGPG
ncbi:MAG: cell division protein FtsW [Actinobacteria bacterium RBG_16_64_13]|nr:MAG: cell division protein FtsW [Actinobacteria bacterium RBG_16_64_13]